MSDFREKLVAAASSGFPELEHYSLFYAKGSPAPISNHLDVATTFTKFCADFLPQCPIVDPLGRKVKIRKDMYPKFLGMEVREGFFPKKPSTIVREIEGGTFKEQEYDVEKDRLLALFWVPDVIRDPDAIFKVKKTDHLVKADEVYIKVFEKAGSKVKLVFIDRVGRQKDIVFVTSYLTPSHTAIKYCDGKPIYIRP
jgi:hypothetical protein